MSFNLHLWQAQCALSHTTHRQRVRHTACIQPKLSPCIFMGSALGWSSQMYDRMDVRAASVAQLTVRIKVVNCSRVLQLTSLTPVGRGAGVSTAVQVRARAALSPCPMKLTAGLAPQRLRFSMRLQSSWPRLEQSPKRSSWRMRCATFPRRYAAASHGRSLPRRRCERT